MKKVFSFLGLVLLAGFFGVSSSNAQYSVSYLTNSSYNNYGPIINSSGDIVWVGFNGSPLNSVFAYDSDTGQVNTVSSTIDWACCGRPPMISDGRDITWWESDGSDSEIYIYDIVSQNTGSITNNSIDDVGSFVNANGDVVWSNTSNEIYFYNGSDTSITQLQGLGGWPELSDDGFVAWVDFNAGSGLYELYLNDGITTNLISANLYIDATGLSRNGGYLVWMEHDGNDVEIFQYDGTVTQITNNSDDDYLGFGPTVNSSGDIVFSTVVNGSYEIVRYDYATAGFSYITNDSNVEHGYAGTGWFSGLPKISDSGVISWSGCPAGGDCGFQGTGWEVYVLNGTVFQLTNNTTADTDSIPSANGKVVWVANDGSFDQIAMAEPVYKIFVGQEGGNSEVRAYDGSGNRLLSFSAFGSGNTTGSVRLVRGDVNGDGFDEIIAGQEGGASEVRVFDGQTGALISSVAAFGTGNTSGSVRLATADVNGDGLDEVIVGQEGGSSIVRVFDGQTLAIQLSFAAFGGGNTSGSVRLATGDVDGNGTEEIIVGQEGGNSEVRVYDGVTGTRLLSFAAFGSGNTSGSVRLATADVDGDGNVEIVTGHEVGNSEVRVYDGVSGTRLLSFRAFGSVNSTGSVRLATGDIDGDGIEEIITGQEGGTSEVRVYNGLTGNRISSFIAFGSGNTSGSVRLVTVDIDGDGNDEIITGQEGGASEVRAFDGATGTRLLSFVAFGGGNTSGSVRMTTGMPY